MPALIVLFWLFVVGPLGSFAGQLSDVQENDAAGFLPASAESTQVRELSLEFVTSDTLPAIVVYEFGAPIGPEELAAISTDIEAIAEVPGVTQPVIGPVPSEDGLAVTVIANLEISPDVRARGRGRGDPDDPRGQPGPGTGRARSTSPAPRVCWPTSPRHSARSTACCCSSRSAWCCSSC